MRDVRYLVIDLETLRVTGVSEDPLDGRLIGIDNSTAELGDFDVRETGRGIVTECLEEPHFTGEQALGNLKDYIYLGETDLLLRVKVASR